MLKKEQMLTISRNKRLSIDLQKDVDYGEFLLFRDYSSKDLITQVSLSVKSFAMEKKVIEKFSAEQLACIEKLQEVLLEVQKLDIHISGINSFELNGFLDSEGNPYIALW